MKQSRLASLTEAIIGTFIGLFVAIVATRLICWYYSIPMTWEHNFILTSWLTVVSIVRSYLLRRLFNKAT